MGNNLDIGQLRHKGAKRRDFKNWHRMARGSAKRLKAAIQRDEIHFINPR